MIMLLWFLFTAELEELYAFHYTAPDIADRFHGWDLFDLQSEYLRQGVPNNKWVLTNINKDYEVRRQLQANIADTNTALRSFRW